MYYLLTFDCLINTYTLVHAVCTLLKHTISHTYTQPFFTPQNTHTHTLSHTITYILHAYRLTRVYTNYVYTYTCTCTLQLLGITTHYMYSVLARGQQPPTMFLGLVRSGRTSEATATSRRLDRLTTATFDPGSYCFLVVLLWLYAAFQSCRSHNHDAGRSSSTARAAS